MDEVTVALNSIYERVGVLIDYVSDIATESRKAREAMEMAVAELQSR